MEGTTQEKIIVHNIECTLKDRLSLFLKSDRLSDVTFYVGQCDDPNLPVDKEKLEKIYAHQFLLSASSPVMEAMFIGDWAEKDEVIITDIHSNAFMTVLK